MQQFFRRKASPQFQITVPVFTTFGSKDKQGPDDMQLVIIHICPDQPAKCPEGQATEGSEA